MTLQVIIGGSDGILVASDRKQLGVSAERSRARYGQTGVSKVLLSKDRKIAIGCSGSELVRVVGLSIIERPETEGIWSDGINSTCTREWNNLPAHARNAAWGSRNALFAIHCEKREARRIEFQLRADGEHAVVESVFHRRSERFRRVEGDVSNPAVMILEKYLPRKPCPIRNLRFLAAFYILMGGQLNPDGIEGLAIYTSKDDKPFEETDDDTCQRFYAGFERLDKYCAAKLTGSEY